MSLCLLCPRAGYWGHILPVGQKGLAQLAPSVTARSVPFTPRPDLAKRRDLLRRLVDQSVVELRMATMLQQAASSAAESGGWGSSTGGLASLGKKVPPSLRVLRRLSSVDEYNQLLSCNRQISSTCVYGGHFCVLHEMSSRLYQYFLAG